MGRTTIAVLIAFASVSCNQDEQRNEFFHQHASPEFRIDSHYYQASDLCVVTVWRMPKGIQSVFSTPKDAPLDPLFCVLLKVKLPSAKNKQWGAVNSHDDMTAKLVESANEKVWYKSKYAIDPDTGAPKTESIMIADRPYSFEKGRLFLVDSRSGAAPTVVQLEGNIPAAAAAEYVRTAEKVGGGQFYRGRELLRQMAAENATIKTFVGVVK